MGTLEGAMKTAASRIGCSVEEYRAHADAGEKWCRKCVSWKPRSQFHADRSRGDGLEPICTGCRHTPRTPRKSGPRGRRYVAARDGDREQARGRVNHLARVGLLPMPNSVPCVDCGHLGEDRRHEFDHHLGYDAAHHEHVEIVCSACHHAREAARG